jgi:hypothetical protein
MTEALPGPYNYLDLDDSQAIDIIPQSWKESMFTFQTNDRGTKSVRGLRIWLDQTKGMKHYRGIPYIDVGQQKLVYQLEPLLAGTIPGIMVFHIQAHGVRPHKHFSVSAAQLA